MWGATKAIKHQRKGLLFFLRNHMVTDDFFIFFPFYGICILYCLGRKRIRFGISVSSKTTEKGGSCGYELHGLHSGVVHCGACWGGGSYHSCCGDFFSSWHRNRRLQVNSQLFSLFVLVKAKLWVTKKEVLRDRTFSVSQTDNILFVE